jgi:hypothetical protein
MATKLRLNLPKNRSRRASKLSSNVTVTVDGGTRKTWIQCAVSDGEPRKGLTLDYFCKLLGSCVSAVLLVTRLLEFLGTVLGFRQIAGKDSD